MLQFYCLFSKSFRGEEEDEGVPPSITQKKGVSRHDHSRSNVCMMVCKRIHKNTAERDAGDVKHACDDKNGFKALKPCRYSTKPADFGGVVLVTVEGVTLLTTLGDSCSR